VIEVHVFVLLYFRDILVYENRIYLKPIIFNIYVGLWIIQNPPNKASQIAGTPQQLKPITFGRW
jgi:hypothetical protein